MIMRKLKILIITIIGCFVLGTIIGLLWWLCDGGKTRKKEIACTQCGLVLLNRQEIRAKTCEKCIVRLCTVGSNPVKIYAGKWRKEGYLEVIK